MVMQYTRGKSGIRAALMMGSINRGTLRKN